VSNTRSTTSRLTETCVVAVIRASEPEIALRAARILSKGGIDALEITMTVPGGVDVIRQLTDETDALIGAGTVLTAEDAERCANAGAQFIVSPACIEEVVRTSRALDLVVMPGAFTPTEVLTAWQWGADFVKVFPAARLGPRYLADLLAPLPNVRLVPTGGITADNAGEYLSAGASLLGLGSWLVNAASLASEREEEILARAQQLTAVVRDFRRENA
jgi:2-dehydro-3-deoxyphosphogluconate aldolase/(4S)-4-hydroxy-2-oxoglutarate aldolase